MKLTQQIKVALLLTAVAGTSCAAWSAAGRCLGGPPPSGPRAATNDYRVLHVPPFVCQADFSLAPLKPLLGDLKRLDEDLTAELRLRAADEPVYVQLFRDEADYRRYVERRFPDVPFRRALFVRHRGQGTIYAFMSEDLAVDLRHESTHALLHAALPHVPLWLDEGLAEYFEVAPSERAFGHPHLGKLRWQVRLGWMPSLARLEAITELDEMRESQYRDAWAWVHFMLHGPSGAHDELVRYLADIAAGRPAGLLSQRLGVVLGEPRDALANHFRGWAPSRAAAARARSVSNQPFRLGRRK